MSVQKEQLKTLLIVAVSFSILLTLLDQFNLSAIFSLPILILGIVASILFLRSRQIAYYQYIVAFTLLLGMSLQTLRNYPSMGLTRMITSVVISVVIYGLAYLIFIRWSGKLLYKVLVSVALIAIITPTVSALVILLQRSAIQ